MLTLDYRTYRIEARDERWVVWFGQTYVGDFPTLERAKRWIDLRVEGGA